MNAIVGLTELMMGMKLNAEQMECVELIYSSADILLSIVNDILDFSKCEVRKSL